MNQGYDCRLLTEHPVLKGMSAVKCSWCGQAVSSCAYIILLLVLEP